MDAEHTLIGGHFDGRRVAIEPDREYLVLAIVPTETTADAFERLTKPIEVDDIRTVEKAIYTRRRIHPDRFAPLIYFAAVELTDREALALVLGSYPVRSK